MARSKRKTATRSKRLRAALRHRGRKPVIAIIGAGRLGTALAIGLSKAGYRVDLLVTKHAASARRAARLIGKTTGWLTMQQLNDRLGPREWKRLSQSELIIISTPDDAISSVAAQLSALFISRGAQL